MAGIGTRFMPVTKVIPKELLPIVDKPVIQYLVEEAVKSGIEEVIFVISEGKELIRDHFSENLKVERFLRDRGKNEMLDKIQPIHKLAKFSYVYQHQPLGDGHAILQAEALVGNEPFAVLFGDDIVQNDIPALMQLIAHFKGDPVIAVEKVIGEAISSYGVIDPESKEGSLYKVKGLVEKPHPSVAPSDLGVIGKYVVPASIFSALREAIPGKDGEIRLIDGFIKLMEQGDIYACHIEGIRYDTGKPEGLIEANKGFWKALF